MIRSGIGLAACALALLILGGPAFAVTQVPAEGAPMGPKLTADVWINKEEGGVYQPGESMRVFFRTSADAYVLVYNIDTDGYIHLVYPYGPSDQMRVEGGRTYIIPARHDPYELVADGPTGMEFVVAVASRTPFLNLPWYLTSGAPENDAEHGENSNDPTDSGVIVGDPYVGMEQLNRRIISQGNEADSDIGDIYFYIEKRVEYPRYVCADCHYPSFGFDPYLSVCPVVDIRIDATWVRYAPVHVGVARPRYYYWVRGGAPDRYRASKERWSSIDGGVALRSRFVVAPNPVKATPRELKARRVPPEFQDLRRTRPGRLWQGRDEVLRLWEQQQRQRSDPSRSSGQVRSSKERPNAERPAPDQKSPDRSREQGQSGNRDRGKSGDSGGKEQPRGGSQERDRGQSQDQGKSHDQGQDRSREQERSHPQSPPPKNDVERRDR